MATTGSSSGDVFDELLSHLQTKKKLTKLSLNLLAEKLSPLVTFNPKDKRESLFVEIQNSATTATATATATTTTFVFTDTASLTPEQKELLNPLEILYLLIQFVNANPENKTSLTKEFLKDFFFFQALPVRTDDDYTKYQKILESFLTEINILLKPQVGGGLNKDEKKSSTRKRKQPRLLPS